MTTTAIKTKRAQAEHRKAEEQAARAIKAYRMRREGKSWFDIAEALQITEAAAAHLVKSRLEVAADLVDEGSKRYLLAMEVERLDQLQSAVWGQAISGDLAAVDRALKVIQARAKLLGLEDMTVNNITNNTVVIAGNGEDYVAALRAYANTPAAIEG